MVFSSIVFLAFFLPVTLAVHFLLPKRARNYWLLAVSLLFYFWGAHEFLFVMLASIAANYIAALIIHRLSSRKLQTLVLVIALAVNLGILFYNKYMNFATSILNRIFGDSITITSIALPIGISFFTFQAMSYVIDVYRGNAHVQKNPCFLALYVSFFPQLVAGPIVRYTTVEAQIRERQITFDKFRSGVSRFMGGFCQKILLSNTMAIIADEAFGQYTYVEGTMSVAFAWIGALAYSLQIFFDFSGYSSMAIGLGRMFGFDFLENFNYPYISKTVTEFWRRWHISLGSFFRDYVYFPLGGSRVTSKFLLVRNLFVVWLLTGIWHGASFTFIFWGLWYFALLCFEKLTDLSRKTLPAPAAFAYRIFTLVYVVIGWVFFRSDYMSSAVSYCKVMFGIPGNPLWCDNALRLLNDYRLVFPIALLLCTPFFPWLRNKAEEKFHAGQIVDTVYDLILLAGVLLGISSLVMGVNNPFIYFNF